MVPESFAFFAALLLRHAMVRHFEKNYLLPSGQHGFRSFHSTLTQLLAQWDTILEDLQEGGGGRSVYIWNFEGIS